MKKNRNYYAPKRWRLGAIIATIDSIKKKVLGEPKRSQYWYVLQMKRELMQMKKHIIFMEEMIDRLEGENFGERK